LLSLVNPKATAKSYHDQCHKREPRWPGCFVD
jgi:hypothetical protein